MARFQRLVNFLPFVLRLDTADAEIIGAIPTVAIIVIARGFATTFARFRRQFVFWPHMKCKKKQGSCALSTGNGFTISAGTRLLFIIPESGARATRPR